MLEKLPHLIVIVIIKETVKGSTKKIEEKEKKGVDDLEQYGRSNFLLYVDVLTSLMKCKLCNFKNFVLERLP